MPTGAYVYNSRDVNTVMNGTLMDELGFVEDADHIVVRPPEDQADVIEDKSGRYHAVSKRNSTIGEITFSVIQGSPAHKLMKTWFKTQKIQTSFVNEIIIESQSDHERWHMVDGVITKEAESPYGPKTGNREYTIKGSLTIEDIQGEIIPTEVDQILGTLGTIKDVIG